MDWKFKRTPGLCSTCVEVDRHMETKQSWGKAKKKKADQPPALKHTFHDKKTTVTIKWLSSSKTLNLQGPQDQIASIERSSQVSWKIPF